MVSVIFMSPVPAQSNIPAQSGMAPSLIVSLGKPPTTAIIAKVKPLPNFETEQLRPLRDKQAEIEAARVAAAEAAATAKKAADDELAAKAAAVVQTQAPAVVRGAVTGDVWYRLRMCESTNNYANRDTGGNGHYGAYQFSLSTWAGVGGVGNPADASPAEQDMRAQILQAKYGWGQWECKV